MDSYALFGISKQWQHEVNKGFRKKTVGPVPVRHYLYGQWERYYGRKFTSREPLSRIIREYIVYCNFSRLQRRPDVHTYGGLCPMPRSRTDPCAVVFP